MKRGSLCWASLEPRTGAEQRGRRPVVVVSHDGFNDAPGWGSLIVVPLSTSQLQAMRSPTVVELKPEQTGLPRTSYALCHQITTLDRSKLEPPLRILASEILGKIGHAIAVACQLGNSFG